MESMFTGCVSLKSVSISNAALVTNMSYMFNNCYSLQRVSILNTTSALIFMIGTFNNCYSLKSVPLFNTSGVTNMITMFQNF